MNIEIIKKELLEDRNFREELFKRYYEDDERFINKTIIDGEEVGKLNTPSMKIHN